MQRGRGGLFIGKHSFLITLTSILAEGSKLFWGFPRGVLNARFRPVDGSATPLPAPGRARTASCPTCGGGVATALPPPAAEDWGFIDPSERNAA